MKAGRPYLSIGEVLDVLKPEFRDVSVSKIRFLEGEGLIQPERTPTGYRKFYQRDLERLRYVLVLQRDSYLPLKVIRERLAAVDGGEPMVAPAGAARAPSPASDGALPAPAAADEQAPDDLEAPARPLRLTESDLADAAGLELGQVHALREFGVVCEHASNGASFFDADDLEVARVAREMLKLGIEARHLRMLRRYAEQEAGMYEQLVAPALRNRKPEARQQATEALGELVRLSRRLRQTYLRSSLRAALDGDR